jgi:Flp pilus assembly protein TadB
MTPRERPPDPPLQFRLRALLALMVAVSLLFGLLRWLNVPPLAATIVLVILVVSVVAAVGLVWAISASHEDDDR